MDLWIYAKSSHRDGLENVRRCAAMANHLQEFSPTLCTGDYRAASIAKDVLQVNKTMGIDAVGNLPYTMERLDILIYDNDEVTEEMHDEMEDFCTQLYKVGEEIPFDLVDEQFFAPHEQKYEKAIFFGDDDYQKWFVSFCEDSSLHAMTLINGNYFFLDTMQQFQRAFQDVVDEEEYVDRVRSSSSLLSASVHTCLESLAAGNRPVYFRRGDKVVEHEELLGKYGIPVASGKGLDALVDSFESIIKDYPTTKKIQRPDLSSLKARIQKAFDDTSHITPAKNNSLFMH